MFYLFIAQYRCFLDNFMISKEFVKSGSILVQLIFVHINIIFLNSP